MDTRASQPPPPQQAAYQPDTRPTSRIAVISMILGILFFCLGPFALIPLVLGIIGITKTTGKGPCKGIGFASAGTALGAAGLLGTVVSIGIMYPAIKAARQAAQQVRSETHMRSLSQGLLLYAENNRDRFPPQSQWPDALIDSGIVAASTFESPAEDGDGVSYIFLSGAATMDARQILIYEDPDHHPRGVLVGFADGHVELVPHDEFNRLLAGQAAESP